MHDKYFWIIKVAKRKEHILKSTFHSASYLLELLFFSGTNHAGFYFLWHSLYGATLCALPFEGEGCSAPCWRGKQGAISEIITTFWHCIMHKFVFKRIAAVKYIFILMLWNNTTCSADVERYCFKKHFRQRRIMFLSGLIELHVNIGVPPLYFLLYNGQNKRLYLAANNLSRAYWNRG